MVGDNAEGALTVHVEGGADGQETLRGEQEEYTYGEVRTAGFILLLFLYSFYYYSY